MPNIRPTHRYPFSEITTGQKYLMPSVSTPALLLCVIIIVTIILSSSRARVIHCAGQYVYIILLCYVRRFASRQQLQQQCNTAILYYYYTIVLQCSVILYFGGWCDIFFWIFDFGSAGAKIKKSTLPPIIYLIYNKCACVCVGGCVKKTSKTISLQPGGGGVIHNDVMACVRTITDSR